MIELKTADETLRVGAHIGSAVAIGDVVTLTGALGVGKTTLARGILSTIGFDGDVPSPSFPIVVVYDQPGLRLPIWHVDLYRLDTPADLEGLGLDDALHDGALLVEWPQLLPDNLAASALQLSIAAGTDDARHLTAQVPPSWEARWPFR